MILYDKGLIQLDGKANRYLLPNMQLPTEITVHHLLSHTSGLHNNYNFEDDFMRVRTEGLMTRDIFLETGLSGNL